MKRLLLVLTLALALVGTAVAITDAAEWQTAQPCYLSGSTVAVCFFENGSGGGDNVLLADNFTNHSNLNNYTVTSADGVCSGAPRITLDWNDCISSLRVKLPANYGLCLYADANMTGSRWTIAGPQDGSQYIGTFGNDQISSWQWKYLPNGGC